MPETVPTGHLLDIGFKFMDVFTDSFGIFDFTLLCSLLVRAVVQRMQHIQVPPFLGGLFVSDGGGGCSRSQFENSCWYWCHEGEWES